MSSRHSPLERLSAAGGLAAELHTPAALLLAECGTDPAEIRDHVARALLSEAPELAERLRNRSLVSRARMRGL